MNSPGSSSSSAAASSSRNILLRIPNAKASRLVDGDAQPPQLIALGDFVVYQVSPQAQTSPARRGSSTYPAASGSGSAISNNSRGTPPPVPPRSETLPASAQRPGIVLAVRNVEFPISPYTQTRFEQPNTYVLDNPDSFSVQIELELPRTGAHEILDNVLRRYGRLGGSAAGTLSPLDATRSGQASPSSSSHSSPMLQPSDFKGSLLLVDEDTGKIIGPLDGPMTPMDESKRIFSTEAPNQMAEGQPVVVDFGGEPGTPGQEITISPLDDIRSKYGQTDSKIVGAAEYVSKGILFAADYGANRVSSAAKDYRSRTKATDSPLVFSPTAKKGFAMAAQGTAEVAKVTRNAVNYIGGKVEALGMFAINTTQDGLKKVALVDDSPTKSEAATSSWKNAIRSTVQAALTVADGVEKGGKHFLNTGINSTQDVVGHRFGEEAREVTQSITQAGSNVVLVYVDARGVMHRALLKRVGKAAIRAKMKDGSDVVLDDSGLEGQHTKRDEKGDLIIVDEEKNIAHRAEDVAPAYSSSVETNTTAAQHRVGNQAPQLM